MAHCTKIVAILCPRQTPRAIARGERLPSGRRASPPRSLFPTDFKRRLSAPHPRVIFRMNAFCVDSHSLFNQFELNKHQLFDWVLPVFLVAHHSLPSLDRCSVSKYSLWPPPPPPLFFWFQVLRERVFRGEGRAYRPSSEKSGGGPACHRPFSTSFSTTSGFRKSVSFYLELDDDFLCFSLIVTLSLRLAGAPPSSGPRLPVPGDKKD